MVLYCNRFFLTVSHCHVPLLQRAGELPRSASSHFHNILCKKSQNRQSLHDSFFGNTWQRQHNFFLSGDYDYHHDHLDADQDHDAVNEDETRFHYGWFNQLDNNVDGDYNHPADDDVMTLWKPNSSWSAPCHSS